MHHSLIALLSHLHQKSSDMTLALPHFFGCLSLCDQPLLCFLQRDQPVAVLLCHEKCPGIHLPTLIPSIGHFYFAQLGHSHFAATQCGYQLDMGGATL
jgi:hypothetical protein